MDFDELRIFSKVAELASFSRAADQLGLAKGGVSKAVQQLEARLGTRLLQRTTRSVRLTSDGERFFERCKEFLAEAEQLQAMFQAGARGLSGRLRIDMPAIFAREVIIPRLPDFLAAHPLLEVGISSTDRRVDLVREGFDCVLRVGTLDDSDLVARPLGRMAMSNAASPAYLAAHGTPHSLADLDGHRVVHYAASLKANDAGWEYTDPVDGLHKLKRLPAALTVNSTDAYQAAAAAGLGFIQSPTVGLQQAFAQGRLVPVMPGFTAPPLPVSLMVANRRQLAPRVRAFMDWLSAVLQPYLAEAETRPANRPEIKPPAPPAAKTPPRPQPRRAASPRTSAGAR